MLRLVGGADVDARSASERAFNMKVGGRLRERREFLKLSRGLAAAELLCDETQVMRYEAGATPLKVVTAYRYCQWLRIDMGELFR